MEPGKYDKYWKASVPVAAGIFAAYVYSGMQTPIPGLDQDVADGLEAELHEVRTADGLTLRVKRYANPGAAPVLFCHGFDGNGFEFDLPRTGRNIAVFLARAGYDVWISSFRGCGREPYLCDCVEWDHSIDHLAIYDAPALVDYVSGATGKKPFWIGHSMGGMVLYMYLQGVKFEGENRVVSDPELIALHNSKIAGGIPIASPPAFWWPRLHPFQVFTESSLGRSLVGMLVLYMRARARLFPRFRVGTRIQRLYGGRPRLMKSLSRSPLGLLLYCRRNTDSETTTSLLRWAADDVSCKMFAQLADGIWNIHFRQYFPITSHEAPYDYTRNMGLLSAPLLFVTGDKDFANWEGIREYGHQAVSSEDRSIVTFQGYGHTDLVMGKKVEEDVYPVVREWLDERSAAV